MSPSDLPSLQVRPPTIDITADFPKSFERDRVDLRGLRLHIGLIGIALVLLYAPVFKDLWNLWMTREDYSHGFLIPLISLYLIRTRWQELKNLSVKPVPAIGFGIILLSLAAFFVGVAGGIITISSVSFMGVLMGLALMLCGWSWWRALSLPIAYLIFMTPVLDVLVEPLHRPLQLLAAKVVSTLFAMFGVPTYLDGTFIQFPNGTLEVAIQCSGAGFLISVVAIGLPLASLALRTWRARVTLLVMALVMSVVANWLRVALIGMIGYLTGWGPAVHGPLHILQGMLVYWIGFGVLFAGTWILAKSEGRGARTPSVCEPRFSTNTLASGWNGEYRSWWIALATISVAILYLYGYEGEPVAAKQSFAMFPLRIGEWAVDGSDGGSPLVKVQGADQELVRLYRKPDGTAVRLYIAYLESQTHGKELISYLTEPLHHHTAAVSLMSDGEDVPVNAGFWEENHIREPILFWYVVNGRAYANRYEAKMTTIFHALTHRGSQGALVVMSGVARPGDSGEHPSVAQVEDCARKLLPVLQSFLR